jgi:hypothetical protein
MQVCCLAYSLTLKMEATYSSEASVDLQQTTWHYSSGDRTLQKDLFLISGQRISFNMIQGTGKYLLQYLSTRMWFVLKYSEVCLSVVLCVFCLSY